MILMKECIVQCIVYIYREKNFSCIEEREREKRGRERCKGGGTIGLGSG